MIVFIKTLLGSTHILEVEDEFTIEAVKYVYEVRRSGDGVLRKVRPVLGMCMQALRLFLWLAARPRVACCFLLWLCFWRDCALIAYVSFCTCR